jgi:signal transduction histidine kinase
MPPWFAAIVDGKVTTHEVDAAVLRVLRAFLVFLCVLLAPTAVAFLEHDAPEHALAATWTMLGLALSLLAYLLLPWPRRRFPRAFLPVALAVLGLVPPVGEALSLFSGPVAYQKTSLEYAFIPFVPLFVCAWQYGLRPAVIFTLLVSAADLAMSCLVGSSHAEIVRHVIACRAAVLLGAAYITARLVERERAEHASLCRANAQLAGHALTLEQLATSRERNRIAREIHDTLAHTLSALAVQLEAARTTWSADPEAARKLVDGSLATTRSGLSETRRTLQALRASPVEDLGLLLALRHLAEAAAVRTGAGLAVELPQGPLALPGAMEHGLYRVAEEALENVIRHADAHRIECKLSRRDQEIELLVADDGCGFDAARAAGAQAGGTFGIRGMHERAKMLEGRLTVESTPGKGTTVRCVVKIPAAGEPFAIADIAGTGDGS